MIKKLGEGAERRACKHCFKNLIPVYQLLSTGVHNAVCSCGNFLESTVNSSTIYSILMGRLTYSKIF